jgi:hypothetical protein
MEKFRLNCSENMFYHISNETACIDFNKDNHITHEQFLISELAGRGYVKGAFCLVGLENCSFWLVIRNQPAVQFGFRHVNCPHG